MLLTKIAATAVILSAFLSAGHAADPWVSSPWGATEPSRAYPTQEPTIP